MLNFQEDNRCNQNVRNIQIKLKLLCCNKSNSQNKNIDKYIIIIIHSAYYSI